MSETIEVKFYCGMYRGPIKWQGYGYEPDECCNEGVIAVDTQDWEDECVSHVCDKCGNEFYQSDGHFEIV